MTGTPDRTWVLGLRRGAQIRRGEHTVAAAAYDALTALGDVARTQLAASGMNPAVLDMRNPAWQAAVTEHLLPAVRTVFSAGWAQEDRTTSPVTAAVHAPEPHHVPAVRSEADLAVDSYLAEARNRLVGVSETVYKQITAAIIEGRSARTVYTDAAGAEHVGVGESIPQLAARIDALLSDEQRWRNRATVIARTETIGANNAGAHYAASYNATVMGHTDGEVEKQWLATSDARTRPTHQTANGQRVMGMHTPFTVGGAAMQYPGDPAGPAGEVIQCRCTPLYHYPGDPDYSGGTPEPSAEVDPATGLVPEQEYVDRILADLKSGAVSPAQLTEAVADRAALSQANTNAAIRAYEEHLAELTAAEPRAFASLTEAHTWATDTWGDATTGWTAEQLQALRTYTGSGYGDVNGLLRSSGGSRLNSDIRALDSAMNDAARVPESITVYRGTTLRQFGLTGTSGDPAALIGREFVDHGFLSTSVDRGAAFSGDMSLTIRVPAGSRGIYLSGGKGRDVISIQGSDEHEILFARGSRLRVLSARRVQGRWQVEAELVQD